MRNQVSRIFKTLKEDLTHQLGNIKNEVYFLLLMVVSSA